MKKPEPHPVIAAYINEVSVPGIPWISTSHNTLLHLWNSHGQANIDRMLVQFWDEQRAYDKFLTAQRAIRAVSTTRIAASETTVSTNLRAAGMCPRLCGINQGRGNFP